MEVFFSHHMPRRSWSVSAVQARAMEYNRDYTPPLGLASFGARSTLDGYSFGRTGPADRNGNEASLSGTARVQRSINKTSRSRQEQSRAPGTHRFGGKGFIYLSRGVTSCQVPTRTAGLQLKQPTGRHGWMDTSNSRSKSKLLQGYMSPSAKNYILAS
jgi:hypothetical protein